MPIRLLAPLVAALAVLALPAAAGAVIVPQKGMKGMRVGMTTTQVRAAAGEPTRIVEVTNEIIGPAMVWRYGLTRASFDGRSFRSRVITIDTTSRRERMANGIGVGSTRRQVRRKVRGVRCRREFGVSHCFLGRFRAGRIVTDFRLNRRGRVTSIAIGRVVD